MTFLEAVVEASKGYAIGRECWEVGVQLCPDFNLHWCDDDSIARIGSGFLKHFGQLGVRIETADLQATDWVVKEKKNGMVPVASPASPSGVQ